MHPSPCDQQAPRQECASPLRLLFAASEIQPLSKTGGLGDVCATLPRSLAERHVDVRLLTPAYPSALAAVVQMQPAVDLGEVLGEQLRLIPGRVPGSGLPVWLVDCARLYRRPGGPYQDADGRDWDDNDWRFGVFCHVAARLALGHTGIRWRPDIVHCHDWQTGLVPLLLSLSSEPRPRSVFTIHNAAFQGLCALETGDRLQLPRSAKSVDGAEFYGRLSFLKAGVRYADKLTAVSPRYARELRTPEFGMGLEGLFQARAQDLTGIMNGIDDTLWDPAVDAELPQRYSHLDRRGKTACKLDLQRSLGLHENAAAPLAIFASRLTPQKMADTLLQSLPGMMSRHPQLQFAMLSRGDRELEQSFSRLAAAFPGRASVRIDYAEPCARRLHAGGDLLLHGARFEPCGLVQQYAMRYGTLPVVRRVGGLADSVTDADEPQYDGRSPNGFVFDDASGSAFETAIARGVHTYEHRLEVWQALQQAAMAADWGWNRAVGDYLDLYGSLLSAQPLAHSAPNPIPLSPRRASAMNAPLPALDNGLEAPLISCDGSGVQLSCDAATGSD
jgi:starch synthase